MKLSGNDYAKVNARMLEFRTDNPRGKIDTHPEYMEAGDKTYIQFKATIIKDKADECSAEATGHARLVNDDKQKTFEKCETIAVGRALAFLGYGADGEIASSEEMEEFLQAKQERLAEQVFEATEQIGNCDTLEALKTLWAGLSGELKNNNAVLKAKDARKSELSK